MAIGVYVSVMNIAKLGKNMRILAAGVYETRNMCESAVARYLAEAHRPTEVETRIVHITINTNNAHAQMHHAARHGMALITRAPPTTDVRIAVLCNVEITLSGKRKLNPDDNPPTAFAIVESLLS
jgi:hypothetical protein